MYSFDEYVADLRRITAATSDYAEIFGEYESYLKEHYGKIAKNARHPCRVRPLQIYSTQSRGYDSTAVNAIAKDFGVDKVFTIPTPRGNGTFVNEEVSAVLSDDGSEICANLGLSCERINRLELESEFPEEYLFYASLHRRADFSCVISHWVHLYPLACLITNYYYKTNLITCFCES